MSQTRRSGIRFILANFFERLKGNAAFIETKAKVFLQKQLTSCCSANYRSVPRPVNNSYDSCN